MSQRPERLKATKLYGMEKARVGKSSDSTVLLPPNTDRQNGVSNQADAVIKAKRNVVEGRISKPPTGYVTRNEMINKLESQSSIKTERNGIPAGFVTREEMEVRVFLRKLKSSDEVKSNLDVNVTLASNDRVGVHKQKNPTRPIKVKHTPSTSTGTKINEELFPVPPKLDATTKDEKWESPTGPLSKNRNIEENKAVEKSSARPTKECSRIDSSSTVASEYIITGRSTSTAIARQTKQTPNYSDRNPSVKIVIMNANGKNDKLGSVPQRRRQAIQNIVIKHEPDLVLFQEFSWTGITGKTWSKHPIPERFVYTGNYDASLMYDSKTFTNVRNIPASALDSILRLLQSNSNNRLGRPFPTDFSPISRMCARIITTSTQPSLEFLCISWHGHSNKKDGGRLQTLAKIEYFEYFMEFLNTIREKFKLPILAGGDYNVDMHAIKKMVKSPLKLCSYEGSERRRAKGIIDFCIITDDLELSATTWVDLEHDTSVDHPNDILDHDPLITNLHASTFGATGAAMGFGKKTSWPSPIVKVK